MQLAPFQVPDRQLSTATCSASRQDSTQPTVPSPPMMSSRSPGMSANSSSARSGFSRGSSTTCAQHKSQLVVVK